VVEELDYVVEVALECTGFLKNFSCEGSQIKRITPIPTVISKIMLITVCQISSESLSQQFEPCSSYFSLVEIRKVRENLKKEKGSVGLNNDHLRKLKTQSIDRGLQLMFNIFWHFSYMPRYYRTSLIHPLFKGGKERIRSNVQDYRGISLSDTVGRLFERVLYERLRDIVFPKIKAYQGEGCRVEEQSTNF